MQILRCKQADRKAAWFLRAACLFCILIATGANADITISGNELWQNQNRTLSENIIIENGGSLTLDGTTVHFQCTSPKQYGIEVKGGARLIVRESSVVRGDTPLNGAFVYVNHDGYIEARDSNFINMGTTQDIYLDAWQRPGIRLWRTDSESGFWNCTIEGGAGIAAQWVPRLRIEGNTFRYTKQENSRCGVGVFVGNGCQSVFVHRNTFETIKMPVYTQFTDDVQITNNVFNNCCYPYVKAGGYAIDLWGKPDKDMYVAFNRLLNVEKNIVLNEYIEDILVEYNYINNTLVTAYGTALGIGNRNNRRDVMRHNTSDNNQSSGGIIGHPAYGLGQGRFLVYGCRLVNVRGAAGLMPFGADMVFSNISFSLAPDDRWGGIWTGLAAIVSNSDVNCERMLFRNLSFSNFMTGIQLDRTQDCVLCDISLTDIKETHVRFEGGNSGLKIINLKFDPARVSFEDGTDIFRPYWYADVKVTNAAGNPVQGATVTVTNEVNAAVGAINRKGEPVSQFITGEDGHTSLPANPMKHTVTSEAFVLDPDESYQFAGWLCAIGSDGEENEQSYVKAYAILYELDEQGEPIAGHPLYVRGESGWVLRNDSFTTLPQTRQGKVELFVYGWGDHAAWFDDLSIKSNGGPNLLVNPGFEEEPGDHGWSPIDGHEGIWDDAQKHSGNRSCKLIHRTWGAEDASTMALCGYSRNQTGKEDFTYKITVEKDDRQKIVEGVIPASSWYRPDPNVPTCTITIVFDAEVKGRHVFYNRSAFDGDNPAANADDDGAVAPDKTALLPGGTATFANYTSYSRGINGIMIDIAGLPDTPTAADFIFKVGNDSTTGSWGNAPAPTSITVREGAGIDGADRITVIWADNAIQKQWLQVTVKATDATGLAIGDVFYFGNAIGETGDSAANAMVTPTDGVGARNNSHGPPNPADIEDVYDFDRDTLVIPTDEILTRNNATNPITALKLITVP